QLDRAHPSTTTKLVPLQEGLVKRMVMLHVTRPLLLRPPLPVLKAPSCHRARQPQPGGSARLLTAPSSPATVTPVLADHVSVL
ncbi:unnamed protein product, partial [Ectocarpus sp. 12 AP-2014]